MDIKTTSDTSLSYQEIKNKIYKLHPLAKNALEFLIKNEGSSQEIPQEILDGAYFLEQDDLVKLSILTYEIVKLDSLGEKFLDQGLPEHQVLKLLSSNSKSLNELGLPQEIISSAMGELKKQGLVTISKNDSGEVVLTPTSKSEEFLNTYKNPLNEFEEPILKSEIKGSKQKAYQELSRRKSFLKVDLVKKNQVSLTHKGKIVAEVLIKDFKDLELLEKITSDMLINNTYENKEFRHYDINIPTTIKNMGRLHPMHEANDILTQIFIELGFKEMEGPIVESEFWCFDALWIPQDHPAREDQDTFYIGEGADVDTALLKTIKNMHEEGIDESHTQKGDFKEEVSKNTILRTHSTSTSFRTLHELGLKQEKGENIDGKYFYVAHNFRNEAVDATHLAEFFQAEGILIADNLSLAGLIGFMKEFYSKLGLTNLKFKPTFNPYTEPSMEIHYFDPKMDKWYSIGNSGIFRPEVLKPFGLENKRIYGFGLGASRVATLLTQKSNMREITGATCDLNWIQDHAHLKRNILR